MRVGYAHQCSGKCKKRPGQGANRENLKTALSNTISKNSKPKTQSPNREKLLPKNSIIIEKTTTPNSQEKHTPGFLEEYAT
jgi:hypothetical protein